MINNEPVYKEAAMDIFEVFVDMQATGRKIKELRQKNNMKVLELAETLGLESEQAIYKWQRGQCLPNADNLVRLSILFGCHIDDILIHNMEIGEDESPLLPRYIELFLKCSYYLGRTCKIIGKE